jgi:GNAT superfamily N-acetyltransferase
VTATMNNAVALDELITIQPATDKEEMLRVALRVWGTRQMIFGFQMFDLGEIDALEMRDADGTLIGVANWAIKGNTAYLCALQVFVTGQGLATRLLAAFMDAARARGAKNVRAMLTNDNTDGMIFYQKNGFRLSNLFVGAVDAFRSKEPGMIAVGQHGLAVHDTLEFEHDL